MKDQGHTDISMTSSSSGEENMLLPSSSEIIGGGQAEAADAGLFVGTGRTAMTDKSCKGNPNNVVLSNYLFVRFLAKDRQFTRVNFQYSIFESCYLRNCTFKECNFTGCKFVGTNLMGSRFEGCNFDYAVFERTIVDDKILSSSVPSWENLAVSFARTLRMNFQQIGDSVAVNKAIRLELDSRQVQLWKAWHSPESYYRQKYANLDRLEMFVAWAKFKILDFIWGNGENALKLIRTFCVILLAIAFVDIFLEPRGGPLLVSNCYHSLLSSAPILFGVESPHSYPSWYLAVIVVTRLAFFGMFLSTLVKRLSRR